MKLEKTILKCNNCETEIALDEAPWGWITIAGVAPRETLLQGGFEIRFSSGKSFSTLAHIKDQLDFCSTRCILSWTEELQRKLD